VVQRSLLRQSWWWIALALALVAFGCAGGDDGVGGGSPSPPEGSDSASASASASLDPVPQEEVRFLAEDGLQIEGTIFGDGDVAVVLAHELYQDGSAWSFFAEELARAGYTALAFSFRGYCSEDEGGCSEDGNAGEDGWMDLAGAVRLLRSRGHDRVYLTGASLGGAAVLRAASEGVPADGAVSLSGVPVVPNEIAPDDLAGVRMPVLLIVGSLDGSLARDMRRVFNQLPEPKEFVVLPTGEHGTDLLRLASTDVQDRVRDLVHDLYDGA
jgi:dienelactone hydrolase